jgi:hypothetical protein
VGRLKAVLNEELLPRPFYALAEPMLGEAEPDVIALQATTGLPESTSVPSRTSRNLCNDASEGAVAVAPCPVQVEEFLPDRYAPRVRRIVVKDAWQDDKVVAVIEVVSRGNKSSRARAAQFLRKSVSLLDRGIHLVVVDLHPGTRVVPDGFHGLIAEELGHSPSEPLSRGPLATVSYQVLETGALRAHFVPLRVGDCLPEMPVFLTPHEFVRLPLETTYAESFRSVPWKFQDLLATPA